MIRTIYTLGYTGTKPEQIKAIVKKLGALLVDIRFSPHSRVPQWESRNLKALLDPQYLWLKDLGNVNYKNGGPIQLADGPKAAFMLAPILAHQPVILLCACKEVHTCHRKKAAEYLAEKLGGEVVHISALDLAKPEKKAETPTQEGLF